MADTTDDTRPGDSALAAIWRRLFALDRAVEAIGKRVSSLEGRIAIGVFVAEALVRIGDAAITRWFTGGIS